MDLGLLINGIIVVGICIGAYLLYQWLKSGGPAGDIFNFLKDGLGGAAGGLAGGIGGAAGGLAGGAGNVVGKAKFWGSQKNQYQDIYKNKDEDDDVEYRKLKKNIII